MEKQHMRHDGRHLADLRPVTIEPNYVRHPAGSALIRFGETWVLCTASVEERVPPFLVGKNQGWVTAEYNMLPGSGTSRVSRTPNGRSKEIERLISRSLRAAIDLNRLGNRTFTIDCDVIQADGGTRTAAITGGFVAMALAIQRYLDKKAMSVSPLVQMVAAVSVGLVQGRVQLDLDYEEDSQADVDMNVVMAKKGQESRFIEIQGTAEKQAFDQEQLVQLSTLAMGGILTLFDKQREALAGLSIIRGL